MPETTQTSGNLKNTVSANDPVFLGQTRNGILTILNRYKHSLPSVLMQPIRNAVAGWLGVEYWPNTTDWSQTVIALTAYRAWAMNQISVAESAKNR